MKLNKIAEYEEDVNKIARMDFDWDVLKDKTILISGATGMIGSFLIDVLMKKENIKIIALGRNEKRAYERFEEYWTDNSFKFYSHDINQPFDIEDDIDFILHLASNTHPLAYSNDPIGTITTNVLGTYNLLNLAVEKSVKRFVLASSVEVYGENKRDVDQFDESYCGYIDCNTLRAGYPESKRVSEALCQAYIKQKNLDIVIPRLSRVYGPTMLDSDTKAISQFIKKAVKNEDIVLKSEGTQLFSYSYVADVVSAIICIILKGNNGEAYNVSDKNSNIQLKDLAKIIANYAKKEVIFELPDENERTGYSTATKAIQNSDKLVKLGWKSFYPIEEGITRTISIMKKMQDKNQ